jgi:Na+/melibiose symporter-like transporter
MTGLTIAARRLARRRACQNGALWGAGNGLVSTTLIVYLAQELGAPKVGLGISLILAAPRIVGLLRMAAPALIAWFGDRKRFCLGAYAASAVVLAGLPWAALPGWIPRGSGPLAVIVALWCLYHLLEFLATVALFCWLADLVPLRIRGRFLGRRERWILAGQIPAMLFAGLFSYKFKSLLLLASVSRLAPSAEALGYLIPAALGAGFLLLAVVPLAAMPHVNVAGTGRVPPVASSILGGRHTACACYLPGRARLGRLRQLVAPFLDRPFLALILFGCWFSFSNGVTQAAQNIYPKSVLGLSLFVTMALSTGMRLGQLAVSPWLGRIADRWGNKRLMAACLPLVALGPLFFCAAVPRQPWWVVGAWAVWIAYAGINVGQPNLMLKLAPRQSSAAYVAAFHAVTGLMVAGSTIAGGCLIDHFSGRQLRLWAGSWSLDVFQVSFLLGATARLLGVLLLLPIGERPAETAEIEPPEHKLP